MNNINKPVVSFCIPVYNNAEAALKIVQGLLVSDNTRFEVVVSDDASSDNAQELLSQVHDSRFKYYRNEKNLGAHQNWLHSLELGRGEWLYLVMGRDGLHGDRIDKLIELLEYAANNGIVCMKDRYSKKDLQIYKGIDAMICFICSDHPTGLILCRETLLDIPERASYMEINDMWREVYLRHAMLLKGHGAVISSGVWISEDDCVIDRSKVKSTVEHDVDIMNAYYAPKNRIKNFYAHIDLIDGDCPKVFTQPETDKYLGARFKMLLFFVTIMWRYYCTDPLWTAHYGHSIRNVSIKEMLHNIFDSYNSAKNYLKSKNRYALSRRFIMYRTLVSFLAWQSVKEVARRVLKPLGIWEKLKAIKNNFPRHK